MPLLSMVFITESCRLAMSFSWALAASVCWKSSMDMLALVRLRTSSRLSASSCTMTLTISSSAGISDLDTLPESMLSSKIARRSLSVSSLVTSVAVSPVSGSDGVSSAAMALTGRTLMSIISTRTRDSSRCGILVFFIDRLPSCFFRSAPPLC